MFEPWATFSSFIHQMAREQSCTEREYRLRHRRRYRKWYFLIAGASLWLCVRTLIVSQLLDHQNQSDGDPTLMRAYLGVDLMAQAVLDAGVHDTLLFRAFVLVLLFLLSVVYTLFCTRNPLLWSVLDRSVVDGKRSVWQRLTRLPSPPPPNVSNVKRKRSKSLADVRSTISGLWLGHIRLPVAAELHVGGRVCPPQQQQQQQHSSSSSMLFRFSSQTQARLTLVWIALEAVLQALVYIVPLPALPLAAQRVIPLLIAAHPLHTLAVLADSAVIMFASFHCFRCFVLHFALMMMLTVVVNTDLRRLHRFLVDGVDWRRFDHHHQRHLPTGELVHRCRLLSHHRHWHNHASWFVAQLNRRLVSRFYFHLIVSNFLFNVYAVFFTWRHREFPVILRTLMATLAVTDLAVPLAVALLFVHTNRLLYRSTGTFLSLLVHTGGAIGGEQRHLALWRREQWKASVHYEQTHRRRRKPAALSAGLLGVFGHRALLQFVLIYAAFLMHFAKQLKRGEST